MKLPQPREIGGQLKQFYQNLTKEQKIIGGVVLGLVLVGIVALVVTSTRVEWGLLYRGLPEETAAEVVNYLKGKNIPYKLEPDGTIRVPKEKVPELRMEIAAQGLVGGVGPGFELFDKGQIGATEFVQQVNYQRALENELARTIMGLKAVKFARVHLAMPRESLFIEEEKPPKASVFIQLKQGYTLSKRQIQGIVNLVSGAVPGLTPENVSIVDTTGRVLFRGEEREEEPITALRLRYRQRVEEALRKKVEDLLSKALGPGSAVAQVSVDLDFDQGAIREEVYDPEMTAVVSESLEEARKYLKAEGGPAGVKGALALKLEGNLTAPGQGEVSYEKKVIRNYEPSRRLKEVTLAPGRILRLSVAVLVDENVLPKDETEAKLEWIEKIVKGAVGYNPERGDVVEVSTLPFVTKEAKKVPVWMEFLLKLSKPLIQLLIVLLVLLLVVRPILKAVLEKPAPVPEEEALPEEEEVKPIEEEEKPPLPQEMAMGIVQSSPERAALLVKKWLLEESAEERAKALREAA